MKPPTNTDLLMMSEAEAKLLTGLDPQRRFVMRVQAQLQPCPNCGHKQNYFQAANIEMNEYDFGVTTHPYSCVHCKRALEHCVPLAPVGTSWFWSLVPAPDEVPIESIEYSVGDRPLKSEPMVFRRLYAEGQPIRMDFIDYQVVSVVVVEGVQKVCLKPCQICTGCGGIVRQESKLYGCSCAKP